MIALKAKYHTKCLLRLYNNANHVSAVEALTSCRLVHLGDVGRDIFQQHAPPVRHLHISTATQRAQKCCNASSEVLGTVLLAVMETDSAGPVLPLLEAVRPVKEWETRR